MMARRKRDRIRFVMTCFLPNLDNSRSTSKKRSEIAASSVVSAKAKPFHLQANLPLQSTLISPSTLRPPLALQYLAKPQRWLENQLTLYLLLYVPFSSGFGAFIAHPGAIRFTDPSAPPFHQVHRCYTCNEPFQVQLLDAAYPT